MRQDSGTSATEGWASFGARAARDVVECVDLATDPTAMDAGGLWFVVADFEGPERGGRARAWRFAHDMPARARLAAGEEPPTRGAGPWRGPDVAAWTSSMTRAEYEGAVAAVRSRVQEGEVYQANICRVLSAPLVTGLEEGSSTEPDAAALAAVLAAGNPAPYGGAIHVPAGLGVDPVWVVSASPELFLRVEDGVLTSGPIKGTAATAAGLGAKDQAENVMITDLVRNDLQRVCQPGSVAVDRLLAVEQHPGLVHLVSTVSGTLAGAAPIRWGDVLAATSPPASVSGAPKSSALRAINDLETAPRGPYCGAVGWVDADRGEAELAVGIRTFWWSDGVLRFGTGAGITWGSDPHGEWQETELKARRLIGLASAADCDL